MTTYERFKQSHGARLLRRGTLKFLQYALLIGLSYYILSPLLLKIATSFMTESDLLDSLVVYIPREFTLWNYRRAAEFLNYWEALRNTALISLTAGLIQMLVCSLVGYGLAKFKFKGRGLVMAVVFFSIITPPLTYQPSMYLHFRYFDVFGIIEATTGSTINLLDSLWPLLILSVTGFAFKNGLYIFMMMQFFRGFPEELEEAAYVDGYGVFRTFFRIILPNSIPMLITVFTFAFAWQWTDTFYTSMFFSRIKTLSNMLSRGFEGMTVDGHAMALSAGQPLTIALGGTYSLMVIVPLIIVYIFTQRFLTQGIERSGIVG
ncbi:MAG: carbohydrate ABC transporter permease [Lachnospiraceae bacterium]|uniref:carbohydrate ABC transporter permease n=1 Tax=uncultured Acetatifactor sp. TaxID=1671927 RepID=UPI00261A51EA|nr:carbohydrate ABC transporter permease [uncultured Acetatifactor sp.]MCI8787618.1 carbohydrate ABC transporter permease [Lachnospiraceae bacterium]